VDPVNAKLELVVEGHGVEPRLDVHLLVDAPVHPAQVVLDFLEGRGAVGDLQQSGGHIHREGLFALFGEQEGEFGLEFLPEINGVIGGEVDRGAAITGSALAPPAPPWPPPVLPPPPPPPPPPLLVPGSHEGRALAHALAREAQIIDGESPGLEVADADEAGFSCQSSRRLRGVPA